MEQENNIGEFNGVETETISSQETSTDDNQEEHKVKATVMNSFVTTRHRPPRVPKQAQSTVTTGMAETDTFHNQQQQQQVEYSSQHRHRSSSQPRPSQLAVDPSPSAPDTSRSASQPRALQNAHFLDGFNVATCFDVRAIPDPPSPSNSISRHRRRVSSAVLRPMSSMDITNRGNNQATTSTDTNGIGTKSSSSARRKRKTLSHVPSPLCPEGEQKVGLEASASYEQGREENNDGEVRPKFSK